MKELPRITQRARVADRAHARPPLAPGIAHSVLRIAATIVDENLIAHWTTEQTVDWLIAHLAENIPQCHIDRRQGPKLGAAHAKVRRPFVQETPVRLDRQRVLAQQPTRHPIVQHRLYRLGAIVGLAVANNAGVSMDPD